MLCVEYLCLNNATVDIEDEDQKTPLDFATAHNDSGILDILVHKLEKDLRG